MEQTFLGKDKTVSRFVKRPEAAVKTRRYARLPPLPSGPAGVIGQAANLFLKFSSPKFRPPLAPADRGHYIIGWSQFIVRKAIGGLSSAVPRILWIPVCKGLRESAGAYPSSQPFKEFS
ncbi:hypothetical protein LJC15_03055 [Desulfovibrio sp. OttesenSCG-928-G11]|nr:hypothetical protein [Desulfovibrio sp. OttesenSCG-928-G11]